MIVSFRRRESDPMKNSRFVFFPAILVAVASLCLIVYSFLGFTPHRPPSLHTGVPLADMGPRGERGSEGLFRTLGTCAVFLAAASYAWLRLKRKRKSPSPLVQLAVKGFDKLHKYAGYAAIVLIAVHGIYFLTQAAIKKETYTGLAAFGLLFALGLYGFLIRRVSNKYMRKIHFSLATAFAAAALLHAGGSAVMAVVFWGLIWLIERSATPAEQRQRI
jgi:hypothetical protein